MVNDTSYGNVCVKTAGVYCISYRSPHPSTPFSQKGIGNLLSHHTPPPCWFQTPYTHTPAHAYTVTEKAYAQQKVRN